MDRKLSSARNVNKPCKTDHVDIFLGLDEETIKNDIGKTSKNRICIKDSFKMGLIPDVNTSTIKTPAFAFSLYQCANSSKNNNSCPSQPEIDYMIKYTTIQTSVPTTVYDFNNAKKPQKITYDYRIPTLDKSMKKKYNNFMTTSILYTDYGVISEEYRLQSTNFNPNLEYDPNLRQEIDPLFVYESELSMNFQIYYLKNLKLTEIAGSLGGLLNMIFLLGKMLCVTYNSIYMRFEMINSAFSHTFAKPSLLQKRRTESLRNSITAKITRNFSYFAYLFPSKEVRIFYQKGSRRLHEYLDIRNIIKILQDLDKLKMILLTDDQRKIFEYIPKPDVVDWKNQLSLDNTLKYKTSLKTKKLSKNIPMTMRSLAENNDPIN